MSRPNISHYCIPLKHPQTHRHHVSCSESAPAVTAPTESFQYERPSYCSPAPTNKAADLPAVLAEILDLVNTASSLDARAVQQAILEGEEILFNRLRDQQPPPHLATAEDTLVGFATNLARTARQNDVEPLRLKRAHVLGLLAALSTDTPRLRSTLRAELAEARERERSEQVRKVLGTALDAVGGSS